MKGRPKKAQTGKTMFIPAHLVKYVLAMLKADRDDKPETQRELSDDDIANWTSNKATSQQDGQ